MEPIKRMIGSLDVDMNQEEYAYYYRFILRGAYEMVHTRINKESRKSPGWIASLIFRFILQQ